jgi:hypothetical protein
LKRLCEGLLLKRRRAAMHEAIYERLKQVARDQGLITYGELAPLADLHTQEYTRIRGHIYTFSVLVSSWSLWKV